MQLATGTRLAQYEILSPLGAGGMGEVYRARDTKLAREVALKILPGELSTNAEALRRFEQEARAASALNHPSIVTIYEIGHTDSLAWIAMELVDGENLRHLTSREPLTVKSALRIAVKVVDGLSAAHEKGIIHRDLKPDNVMVTADGFVKILDFGLAKQLRVITSDDTTIPHTSPGAVFGTVGYMSPEQATGQEMVVQSDQFSFGVMLYEMLTRVRPFDRETKVETMAAIIRDEVDPPSAICEAVPLDLDRIVARCLAKKPRDRYGSTRDLARDLREIRDGFTHSSARVRSATQNRKLPSRVRQMAALALLAVALIGGAAFMWMRSSRLAGQRVTSLAVVPFRDLTTTGDGRILADGISELIATRLAEVRDLRVSSPFEGAYVSAEDDVQAIARKRGVRGVVRGTVTRVGSDVRVTYALVDGSSGRTLLARTATRPATDLFALEDEIAEELVRTLGRETKRRTEPAVATLAPEDQQKFIEAVGLLQRVRDGKSVDRAITTLESLLRNARESGQVNALLARALLYKATLARRPALLEQAMLYAERGVAFSANDPEAHIALGRLLNVSGRSVEASASFNRALALQPGNADAFAGLGKAYEKQGRAADAERMYAKAIRLQPDSASHYSSFGTFYYAQGRFEDAVRQYRRAAELSPDLAVHHSNLGAALNASGRHDEALRAYNASIAVEPTPNAFTNLSALHFFRGRYAEAQQASMRATELAPSDPIVWANLGDVCRANNARCAADAYVRAIANARAELAIKPDYADVRAVLASALAKQGDLETARREIAQALNSDPTDPDVLYQAAVVALLRGSEDTAMSWLERAIAAGYPPAFAEGDLLLAPLRKLNSFHAAVKSTH